MKVFALLLFLTISYSYAESSYSAVTWNIRFKNSKDSLNGNAWEKRLPHIQEFLKFKKFDIIAYQLHLVLENHFAHKHDTMMIQQDDFYHIVLPIYPSMGLNSVFK